MSRKKLHPPNDRLVRQLWLLKGKQSLAEFTKSFNAWGIGLHKWWGPTLTPEELAKLKQQGKRIAPQRPRKPRSKFDKYNKPRSRWEAAGELREGIDYGWVIPVAQLPRNLSKKNVQLRFRWDATWRTYKEWRRTWVAQYIRVKQGRKWAVYGEGRQPELWARELSYDTLQSYLLGRSCPKRWNRRLIRRKILWLRNARHDLATSLRGQPTEH